MSYIVRMPKLGVEMQEGKILEWHVDEGGEVAEETVLAEIESEKTTTEVTAREDGVLRRVFMTEGDTGPPGAAMGVVAGPEEDLGELLAEVDAEGADGAETPGPTPAPGGDDAEPTVTATAVEAAGPEAGAPHAAGDDGDDGDNGDDGARPKASPRARRRAGEAGVTVADVEPTGPAGAVVAADVERAIDARGASEATIPDATATTRTVASEREQSRMRRTIARRLGESWREAPHVTVDRTVDAEPMLAATDALVEAGHDVSLTDVLLVAVSETLADHPEFNATFRDGRHTLYEEHNIGVAVDIENGLVTPVVPAVEEKSVTEVGAVRRRLTERATSGAYTSEDLSGGTFTVSNLGAFGVDSFTPIINPPEVAILGVGAVGERPVNGDDGLEFRRQVTFSLSFDHRVVDGADAARFLDTLAGHVTGGVTLVL